MKLISTNPAAGFVEIGAVETSTKSDVLEAVAAAHGVLPSWSALSIAERCRALQSFCDEARRRADEIADIMTAETGRLHKDSYADIASGIEHLEAYIAMAESSLAPEVVYEDETATHTAFREPWGVVACVCPWNFPFLNVAWQCGQALLAGNAIVYKNSEHNPLFAETLRSLIEHSEIPNNAFRIVQGAADVGQWLVDADVDMVTFTGSSKTGAAIAKSAGERLLPVHLELGGSSPCIVFEDAGVESIIDNVCALRFNNTGQNCGAVKRLIVHETLFHQVVEGVRDRAAKIIVGDPYHPESEMGSLVSQGQLEQLEAQVADAVAKGANIITGGARVNSLNGAYFQPTVITDVTPQMKVWSDEVFGPVLPIVSFTSEDQAIAMANDTPYGLTAYVMTSSNDTFARVASQLKAGAIGQNTASPYSPQTPFGGYKKSGLGRTNGTIGFHDVTQVKVVATPRP